MKYKCYKSITISPVNATWRCLRLKFSKDDNPRKRVVIYNIHHPDVSTIVPTIPLGYQGMTLSNDTKQTENKLHLVNIKRPMDFVN